MDERIITSNMLKEDKDEMNIRPQSLTEYIGQTDVKENMNIRHTRPRKNTTSLYDSKRIRK